MIAKKINVIIYAWAVVGLAASGCHSMNKTQKGAVIGAGAGGTVGAIIGKAAGNTALGAIIGGALGGTAGAFIGRNMDREAADIQKAVPNARVVRQSEGIIVNFDSGSFFDAGRPELKPMAKTDLRNLSAALKKDSDTNIIIIGHTDNSRLETQNQNLSLNRATAVRNYLASAGIETDRMSTAGKGAAEPVADNSTAEGRAKNRRVELVIIASDKLKNQAKQAQN
ncbi:MAG TPA: OmpA family protein [Mucilaginibacter sp.]|nr:OmpA family protein [Mucilaginibacter sp.]